MSVSGKYLAAVVDGVAVIGCHEWEADDSGGDVLDATVAVSGDDAGFTDTDTGCDDLRVTLRFLWSVLTGIGVTLNRGTVIENLLLYHNENDVTPAYEVPRAIVISRPTTVNVRGRIEKVCTIKNKGRYVEN